MRPRTKSLFLAWYRFREWAGLEAWYHSSAACRDHLIPRFHRIVLDDPDQPYGIELCGKGAKNYFTGERI